MGRTESIVVQVAANYENEKISEMEQFGWSLENREEIERTGEAYTGTSNKATVELYTKLHFSRNKDLDNLDKIKDLEEEYFSLTSPSFPEDFFSRFGCLSIVLFPLLPLYYYFSYKDRYAKAKKEAEEVKRKRKEIVDEVSNYL